MVTCSQLNTPEPANSVTTIRLQDVRSASLFDRPNQQVVSTRDYRFRGESIRSCIANDVLYMPLPKAQVVDGIQPCETGYDATDLAIMQRLMPDLERDPAFAGYSDESVCILANTWSHNFSHWMEELCKVVVLEETGFAGKYVASKTPFAVESLAMLGVEAGRILAQPESPVVYRSCVYLDRYNFVDAYAKPARFTAIREQLLSASPPATKSGARLWIHRSGKRQVVNQNEIDAVLTHYDIETVDFAAMGLSDQIACSRGASILAGPHGSGFMHALFAPPATTLIECFSPGWLNPTWTSIYRMLGQKYFQLTPVDTEAQPYQHGQAVYIDPDHLALTFDHA